MRKIGLNKPAVRGKASEHEAGMKVLFFGGDRRKTATSGGSFVQEQTRGEAYSKVSSHEVRTVRYPHGVRCTKERGKHSHTL